MNVQEEYLPYTEEDDEGEFEEVIKQRVIDDPSPVNKVEPIPAGSSFFLFAQVIQPPPLLSPTPSLLPPLPPSFKEAQI